MRYADAPAVEMTVPTRAAFSAMKTLAWADRRAPRDLADLAALAELGAFDPVGAALVAGMGGWRPPSSAFDQLPDNRAAPRLAPRPEPAASPDADAPADDPPVRRGLIAP